MLSAELVSGFATIFGHSCSDQIQSVIANRSEVERWRLTDDELVPQLWWILSRDNRRHVG
jgi:hypothetical protein